jgi:hypothetical protein
VLDDSGAKKLNEYRNKVALTLNKSLENDYNTTIESYGRLMDAANEKAEKAKANLSALGGTKPNTDNPTSKD